MRNASYALLAALILLGCKSKTEQSNTEPEKTISLAKNSIKKIDVHSHFHQDRSYLPSFFESWNMQSLLVDVAIEKPTGIKRSWDEYKVMAKARPELFWLCSSLIGVGIDKPDFAEKEIVRLTKEIEEGAKMVKVWKNFGMVTKDANGTFIQIDDARLQPIWEFLAASSIPVMAHIGEPIQAWRPLDDPKNPHYGYYTEHPEYHAYKHTEIPAYETIISARDNWIKNNPDLKILCAHMGSMSHDVDMIAERLDKFPNMYVEPAARFGDLVSQDSKKVNAFFDRYQDRVMFGTDFNNDVVASSLTSDELERERAELDADYGKRWSYLSHTDSVEIRSQRNVGLGLSEAILQKVYYQNVVDFLKLDD